jgi:hypothetical protein
LQKEISIILDETQVIERQIAEINQRVVKEVSNMFTSKLERELNAILI